MAMLLEGPLVFAEKDGIVRIVDANGKRVCLSLHDFRGALLRAQEMWARWQLEQLERPAVAQIRRA